MLLKFEFFYASDDDFFEYLLHFYARGFNYFLQRNDDKIELFLKEDEARMLEFCELLNLLANSVFLRKFNVEAIESLGQDFQKSEFKQSSFEKRDFLSSLNSKAFLENKEFVCNEWGEFVEDELSFDGLCFEKISLDNVRSLLQVCLEKLEKNEKIYIKNHLGTYEISHFHKDLKADFLMPCGIKAIHSAFVCSNNQLKLLASLEKPLLKLRFSAVFRQNHELNIKEFRVKLASNIFLFALTNMLFEKKYNFLSFKKIENLRDDFELFELDERLVIVRGLDFLNKNARELILSKEDKNYARLSYILSRFKDSHLLLELSKDYEDILLLNKELNLLNLSLPTCASELYEDIQTDEVGKKLLANFSLNFKLLEGEFKLKNNFYSLLGLVGMVLNLDKDLQSAANKLLQLSEESKMPRGVKIDYRLKQGLEKGVKEFDYTRTLRSVMSFLLAGVDSLNIAYGSVESLAFFLRDVYDELREKKQAQSAIITGSLFENKTLLKNTLKHLKNCELSNAPLYI